MKKLICVLSFFVCLGIISCRTSSSSVSSLGELGAQFEDSFLTLSADTVWKNYKAMFKQGANWIKVVQLNDSSMNLRYDISSYDSKADMYKIKVTSSKDVNEYQQDKNSFFSDLSTVYSFSKRKDCSKKISNLTISKKDYSVIELSASNLSVDDVVAIFPDVEGLRNMVSSATVSMWILPKEAVVLKTQITLIGKENKNKKIDFSMTYSDMVL